MGPGRLHVRARIAASAVACVLIVSSCGSPADSPLRTVASPSGSASSTAPDASTEPTAGPPVVIGGISIPADHFTAPGNPLTLTTTVATDQAVASAIGADGGTLSTTGPDGTTYTLTIPAGALPMAITITLTPITSVSGLPESDGSTTSLGVSLAPDGLPLGRPATLVMTTAKPIPDVGMIALGFHGSGSETGFHLFERSGSEVTLAVEHFSGYVVSYPAKDAQIKAMAERFLPSKEDRLASDLAKILSLDKQRAIYGEDTNYYRNLALEYLRRYKVDVIRAKVAIADRGCAQAEAALLAYVEYQRQREILGLADDPAFDLPAVEYRVPSALVDLAVRLCFKAAYDDCVKGGDFPHQMVYYFGYFTRNELVLGLAPNPEHVALAHDYLTRCGRWRVKIGTSIVADNKGFHYVHEMEATAEFHVQWKAGSGPSGMEHSTIEGFGPTEVTKLADTTELCAKNAYSNVMSSAPATAKIESMSFDHFEGPTLTGNPIPPVPTELKLTVGLGTVTFDVVCSGDPQHGTEYYLDFYMLALKSKSLDVTDTDALATGGTTITFRQDWQFRVEPFKATQVVDGTVIDDSDNPTYVRLEVTVEHDPL